jgi:hypothetical protein
MVCRTVIAGDGVTAIAYTRGERRRNCATPGCRNHADKQCDFPVTRNGKSATCDRYICSPCAISKGRDLDFCPPHARSESSK